MLIDAQNKLDKAQVLTDIVQRETWRLVAGMLSVAPCQGAAARRSCCLHASFAAKEMLKGIFALCLFNKSKNPLGISF